MGQIYVPAVNWALLAGTVFIVLFFKTSSNLAAAYGIAVTATMVISPRSRCIASTRITTSPNRNGISARTCG